MPYYVHTEGSEPETGIAFTSRQDAHEDKQRREGEDGKRTITFVLTEDERRDWRSRELRKFQDGIYQYPPWIPGQYVTWEPADTPDQDYGEYAPLVVHFAHLSLKTPGCIAYTPSDEDGYRDRQVKIKVGRYLEQFMSDKWSRETIASYVDQCKAVEQDIQMTRDPKDIVSIYVNGPRSCMSRRADHYASSVHPAHVYGNSPDLAVAYLGTVSEPTARCIVWPEKDEYTRVYGDTTLEQILRLHGYRKRGGSDYGDLSGARIVAIEDDSNVYVMPYVDAAESADLSDDGKHLVLRGDTGGRYETKVTRSYGGDTLCCGLTEVQNDEDDHGTCDHCGEDCDSNDRYCSSCYDDHWSCCRCGEDYFDHDESQDVDGDLYCTSCASRWEHTCEVCEDTWFAKHPDSEFCSRHEHYSRCDACDTPSDDLDNDQHCANCHVDEDEDDSTEDATVDPVLADTVHPLNLYPTITDEILIQTRTLGEVFVHVLHLSGAIAVHVTLPEDTGVGCKPFTLTHVLTGLVVTRADTLREAIARCNALTIPGVDWGFTEWGMVHSTNARARYYEVKRMPVSELQSTYAPEVSQ